MLGFVGCSKDFGNCSMKWRVTGEWIHNFIFQGCSLHKNTQKDTSKERLVCVLL